MNRPLSAPLAGKADVALPSGGNRGKRTIVTASARDRVTDAPAGSPALTALDPFFIVAALFVMAILASLDKWGVAAGDDSGSLTGQLGYGLIYAYAAFRLYACRAVMKQLVRASLPMTLFVAMMPLSTLWSSAPPTTFRNAIEMIGTTIVGYFIVSRFRLEAYLRFLCMTFAVIAGVCFVLVVFSPAHGRSDWGGGPWTGFYSEKNYFGATMGFAIVAALTTASLVSGRERFLCALLLLLAGTLLVGSTSATALLVTLATTTAIVVFALGRSKRFGLVATFGFGIAVAVVGLAIAATGLQSDTLFTMLGKDSTLTGRADFWPGLVRAIGDRPYLGYGFNSFFSSGIADQYIGGSTGFWHPYHAHNSFYQIALDVGLIGSALFAVVLFLGFKDTIAFAFRKRTLWSAWPLGMVVYLFLTSFSEAHFAMINTTGSVLFVAAILFPAREALADIVKPTGLRTFRPLRERTAALEDVSADS